MILLNAQPSYLTYVNPKVIFIICPVAHGEAQLVLAVHSVEIHFLDKEKATAVSLQQAGRAERGQML